MTRLRADGTRGERERGAEWAPGRVKEQEKVGTRSTVQHFIEQMARFGYMSVRVLRRHFFVVVKQAAVVVMQVQCRPEAIYNLFLLTSVKFLNGTCPE